MSAGVPLRLSRDRVLLYGGLLAAMASLPFLLFPSWFRDVAFRGDFANFWSAGANAGSPSLLEPDTLGKWQVAHHVTPQVFVYPPAFAWFYALFAHVPPMRGMLFADVVMVAALVAAGAIASQIYKFPLWFAIVAACAWGPSVNAVEVGQNAALGLLLALAASWALVARREVLGGLSIGLLMYKPSIALPFIVLLCVRRQWRALGVVAACAACWYFASVAASHGNWAWPVAYAHLVAASNAGEFSGNAHKTYTIPTLLLALHAPAPLALVAGAAVLLAAIPLLARAPTLEAVSMAPAIGIAVSIHSWPYEAALLFPAVCYAMSRLAEPLRTQVVVLAYALAALALVVPFAGHLLAVPCLGATGWWLWSGYFRGERHAYYAQHAR